ISTRVPRQRGDAEHPHIRAPAFSRAGVLRSRMGPWQSGQSGQSELKSRGRKACSANGSGEPDELGKSVRSSRVFTDSAFLTKNRIEPARTIAKPQETKVKRRRPR